MCINILNTATRHADVDLAADVFRTLTNRGARLELHHYEALAETYLASSDIDSALAVYSIAQAAEVVVQEASLHAVARWLRNDRDHIEQAREAVRELRYQGRLIPTPVVNSLIYVAGLQDLTMAVQIYNGLQDLCSAGPSTETFNNLLLACYRKGHKRMGLYYHAEMRAMRIEADATTYHHLVCLCCTQSRGGGDGNYDYEDAFKFLSDMKRRGFAPTFTTYSVLLGRCVQARDKRAQPLLDEAKEMGISIEALRSSVKVDWNLDQKVERDIT